MDDTDDSGSSAFSRLCASIDRLSEAVDELLELLAEQKKEHANV